MDTTPRIEFDVTFLRILAGLTAITLISIVFYVQSAPPVSPSACDREVDLREPGQSLAGYPISHQGFGKTNLCGFFSAATLIDAWRAQQLQGGVSLTRIHPIALAVELARDRDWPIWMPIQNTTDGLNNRAGRWGSIVCSVVDYAREHGVCTSGQYSAMEWKEQGQLADKNVQIYDLLFDFGRRSSQQRKRTLDEVTSRVQQLHANLPPASPEAVKADPLKELISRNETRPYRTISSLMHSDCGTERLMLDALPRCRSTYHGGLDLLGAGKLRQDPFRTDRALMQIHAALDGKRPLPVSIAYCGNIMREGRAFRDRSILSKNCSPHWAVVIGRKRINGQCHLLIRNSSAPEKDYHADWMRDGMDVWIEAQALQRTIYSVQWLETDSAFLSFADTASK